MNDREFDHQQSRFSFTTSTTELPIFVTPYKRNQAATATIFQKAQPHSFTAHIKNHCLRHTTLANRIFLRQSENGTEQSHQ